MIFYENGDNGSWFLRNELGQVVSPSFTLFDELLSYVDNEYDGEAVVQEGDAAQAA